ncbi:unnamed protein product [Linum trigynum]|uniref:Uncharacterized protein n=1 Tax=Linum trigynum TaxID=586398 RepID=A0AAV2FZ17_9ROSI
MRVAPSSHIPHSNNPSMNHQSRLLYHRIRGLKSFIHRQPHPFFIMLGELSHQSREPKLLTLKDHSVSRPPDPPKDDNNFHE